MSQLQQLLRVLLPDKGFKTAGSHRDAIIAGVEESKTYTDEKAAEAVKKTGNETIAGVKTFSDGIVGNITGNASTVTNGVYNAGNQTIGGIKTFISAPVVPDATEAQHPVTLNYISKSHNFNNNIFDYLNLNATEIEGAIKINNAIIALNIAGSGIKLDAYYSITVASNITSYRRIRVFERYNNANLEVCQYHINQTSIKSGIEEIIVPQYNSSNIEVKVLINWDLLANEDILSLFPDKWKINNKCANAGFFNNSYINSNLIAINTSILSNLNKKRDTVVFLGVENLNRQAAWTYPSGGKITSAAIGWAYNARLDSNTCEDEFTLSAKFISHATASNFEFGIGKKMDVSGTAVSLQKLNSDNLLRVYKLNNNTPTLAVSIPLTFALLNNTEYVITMTKNVNVLSVNIISSNLEEFNYTIDNVNIVGSMWGYPSVWAIANANVTVASFNFSLPYKRDCKLLVFGDSFIEGNSIANTKDSRYIAKIRDAIGRDEVAIFSQGGESTTTILDSIYNDMEWYRRAKYCLLALGTNDTVFSNYQSNMIAFINRLIEYDITPILVTITPRYDVSNLTFMSAVNTWVRASGYNYIDINRAVTIDGENWKDGYLLPDNVHPSINAHAAIFLQSKLDCPFLYQ